MKPITFLPIVMIAAAGLVASCSTSKLATTKAEDDVYNSVAKAKEVEMVPQQQYAQNQSQNPEAYDEYYGTSNPYYDMDYSSRINRFQNGTSWRGYYDPYYENFYYGNSYGVTNYLGFGGLGWSSGYGLGGWGGGLGYGYGYGSIWNNPFYYGNFGYGWNSPFYGWNAWGPNSYYDRFGWGGGYYGGGWGLGGGYYGGGVYTNNRTNRPRPGSNDTGMPRTSAPGANPNFGRPSRSGYAGNSNGAVSSTNPNTSGRPTRSYQPAGNGNTTTAERPTQMSRPTRSEAPAPSYSPPPSSSGSSGSSGGGGGGGSRPSRAGRG
ncbi:hypothetical protein [Pedobacter sandarakinus]|uniref:hypothetical protein n=1 Tax=Pedobacter sandarakinus TaxID=353156 RepID=UPI0022455FE1|nr:hypothetical protein [Pedobacter sandarakinus]MCX2575132.1 hypothetical protein [Pedobacter sandarakinus]